MEEIPLCFEFGSKTKCFKFTVKKHNSVQILYIYETHKILLIFLHCRVLTANIKHFISFLVGIHFPRQH